MASPVAARRALTSTRRPDGSCMLSKCYSARERPAHCSLRLRQANCPRFRRTRRRLGPPTAPPPYPSPAPQARIQGSPDGVQQSPPYVAVQRSKLRAGGASSGGWPAETVTQPALREQSDSLCIPYSPGLLGSFSPYRGVPFPPDLRCYECGALQQHYAAECPTVRGEQPPGWMMDQMGAVVKDPAAWNGPDLTDAARAKYRDFLSRSERAHAR